MAIRPDYMVGTITLTNGSKNFTTAGASLQSANVTGGDTIMTADGRVLIIDKVTGQNAGTLRNNSPISASNVSLVIRFQPDGSKYQGATRDLLERWGMTGNIDAIAGLETAKDMLAYFTGAGTADLASLTALGRALIGLNGTNGNIPVMTGAGAVASRPIVGSVSQSGGVPTGALFQYGSNANGEFLRIAGGAQVCWSENLITGGGSTYSSYVTWGLPASFSSRSYSGFSIARSVNPSSADAMRDSQPFFEDVSTSQARVGVVSSGKLIAGGTMAMRAFAIGRWS